MPGFNPIPSSGGVPFGLQIRAWVLFRGVTGVIVKQSNVASVVRSAAGTYTVNLTTPMTDLDFVVTAQDSANGGSWRSPWNVVTTPTSTSQLGVLTYSNSTLADSNAVWLLIAG